MFSAAAVFVRDHAGTVGVGLAALWIVFLIAMDLLSAFLGDWQSGAFETAARPAMTTGEYRPAPRGCTEMPDGLLVCESE